MAKTLKISICTYQGGDFDVIFLDPDTGREITLTGTQKLGDNEFDFANEIAPACVFTKYQRITPED